MEKKILTTPLINSTFNLEKEEDNVRNLEYKSVKAMTVPIL